MFECVALKSLAHHETGNCNLILTVGILPSNYTTTANGASTPRYHGGLFLLQPAEDTLKLDLSSQSASQPAKQAWTIDIFITNTGIVALD